MPPTNLGVIEIGKYAQVPAMFFKRLQESWQDIVRADLFREKAAWIHTVGRRDTHKAFRRSRPGGRSGERFESWQGNAGPESAKKIPAIH